jgi:hypothetical protein
LLRLLGVPSVHHLALQRQAVDLLRLLVAARAQLLDVVRPVLGAPAWFCAQLAQPAKARQLGVRSGRDYRGERSGFEGTSKYGCS